VLNATRIAVTSDKLESKLYSRHGGYPQGSSRRPSATCSRGGPKRSSGEPSRGMLPHNGSGPAAAQAEGLSRVRSSASAQQPEPLA
jgi:ribosomal protein L13